jgi:putative endonuclease
METTLGQLGESYAQAEYGRQGFAIVAKNEFNRKGKRLGEIDFIAKNKDKIIFVEVKTRSAEDGKFGGAAEAVDVFKQRKILKAVKVYLLRNPIYQQLQPQIDVCVVQCDDLDKTPNSVTIITNAVEDFN